MRDRYSNPSCTSARKTGQEKNTEIQEIQDTQPKQINLSLLDKAFSTADMMGSLVLLYKKPPRRWFDHFILFFHFMSFGVHT
tara:strand:+ start:883 stop:1128 length:246 start_codon:yes stop_codon:yes gene_type:complete